MRPLRIEFENAWYHVMNRGVNHQNIFYNIQHREIFLSLLEDITNKFYAEIHAYCLMDNHYHLLMNTPLPNLGKIMQYLDGVYTQRFNRLEKRDGPLFKGRYKAILVEAESYLLQLSRYIHLNPITAKICHDPVQYEWSSYQFYVEPCNKPKWLYNNLILEMMSGNNHAISYANFVGYGLDDEIIEFYGKDTVPCILGNKTFTDKYTNFLNNEIKEFYNAEIKRCKTLPKIETIIDSVTEYYNINEKMIFNKMTGKINIHRMISIFLARQLGQYSYQKISKYFGIKPVSIASALMRFNKIIKIELNLAKELNELSLKILEKA